MNYFNNFRIIFYLYFLGLFLTSFGYSQSYSTNDIPNVYLDCWRCDRNYIKTEITHVNYVRERQEADIHILITQQRTGGGGQEYTLSFIGQAKFSSTNDTLVFSSSQTDTWDIVRQDMVRVIKLGLIQYLLKTPLSENLNVSFVQPREDLLHQIDDRWDNWVFRISLDSRGRGEASKSSIDLVGSISARRITEDWKISIAGKTDYDEDIFKFDDTTYTSISQSHDFDTRVIKSLSDHWSIGMWGKMSSSTYRNIDFDISFVPGIEYNVYPYSVSTRRQLRFDYLIGPRYRDYSDTTIYFKTNEKLFEETISISLDIIQPWGSINTNLSGSHYFHDFEKNRVQLRSNLSLRIYKGLSLNLRATVSRIHNQLSLPQGGATRDEVLLQQKELETQYDYSGSIGLSYSFGSIYSTVVNPRFGNW